MTKVGKYLPFAHSIIIIYHLTFGSIVLFFPVLKYVLSLNLTSLVDKENNAVIII